MLDKLSRHRPHHAMYALRYSAQDLAAQPVIRQQLQHWHPARRGVYIGYFANADKRVARQITTRCWVRTAATIPNPRRTKDCKPVVSWLPEKPQRQTRVLAWLGLAHSRQESAADLPSRYQPQHFVIMAAPHDHRQIPKHRHCKRHPLSPTRCPVVAMPAQAE